MENWMRTKWFVVSVFRFFSVLCVATKFISHWKRFICEALYFLLLPLLHCLYVAVAIKFGCEASAMTTQIEEMWTLNAQPKWQYVFTNQCALSLSSFFFLLWLLLLSSGSEFGFGWWNAFMCISNLHAIAILIRQKGKTRLAVSCSPDRKSKNKNEKKIARRLYGCWGQINSHVQCTHSVAGAIRIIYRWFVGHAEIRRRTSECRVYTIAYLCGKLAHDFRNQNGKRSSPVKYTLCACFTRRDTDIDTKNGL